VGGASEDVGDGRAALLARRSCTVRDMRFLVLLILSCGSVLFVAWEAADGERVDAGDFGGISMMVKVSRSRRGGFQEERFSQSVRAWFGVFGGGGVSVGKTA
jgi:hypothetical protein